MLNILSKKVNSRLLMVFRRNLGFRTYSCLSKNTKKMCVLDKSTRFISFFKTPNNPEYFKALDNIPNEFELIYRNRIHRYIRLAQIFCTITSVIVVIGLFIKDDTHVLDPQYEKWSSATKRTHNESIVFISSFVFLLIILNIFIGRLPMRIYRKPTTSDYVLVFEGNWPFGTKKTRCKIGEVFPMPEKGVLPWKDSRYMIMKETEHKSIIMLDQFFRRPADLSIMIGEQKDPDLK